MKRPQGIQPPSPAAPVTPGRGASGKPPAETPARPPVQAPVQAQPQAQPAVTPAPFPRPQRQQAGRLPAAWWLSGPRAAAGAAAEAGTANGQATEAGAPPDSEALTQAMTDVIVAGAAPASPSHPGTEPPSSADPAASAETTGPLAPVTPLTAAVPLGAQPGADPAPAGEQKPEPLSPSSARARLRAATKARRAYERAEVRRFTRHLRRRRAAWLAGGGAVLALALFVIVGTFSPLMALTTIQVEGANRLVATDVSAALDAQIGTPLPLVDADAVRTALSQFSLIQSYSTESRPPHTLVVRIVEREPIAVIAGPAGFDLVDPAGVVIQTTPERPAGFPLAEVAGPDGLAAAGNVVRALPEDVRAQLDIVRAASTDDVSLVLAGGTSVAWGSAEESNLKALVLSKLMAAAPPGTVTGYDVSSPVSPVVR